VRHQVLPGSVLPLARVLFLFSAHYLLRVAAALHADTDETYLRWDLLVSGLGTGYFLGWSMRFLQSYRTAPSLDLNTAPAAART
jgi:hypothetical protein